ncbi:TlpA family protein disulfide reductase [Tomitella biformata]|uniref:TlpA family protein disulfide reductase n=1 Tax=Tomitella biformata TaxID=630403 RepID=UPI00046340A5|nr:TlpA disulfide reductase family protein [Tomitella biformata]
MSVSAKTGIGVLVVLVALMIAILPIWDKDSGGGLAAPVLPSGAEAPVDTSELAALRADASLELCPAPSGAAMANPSAGGPFAGLVLECLADGSPMDLGAALAGRPAVLNLWAYWCAPCRAELPAMAEFAARAGDAVTVLTVHKDKNQDRGLAMLAELGVQLPGVDDPGAKVAAAASAPNVLPVTVLLRADGTVAKVLAVPFTNADEIADAVREYLGVAA